MTNRGKRTVRDLRRDNRAAILRRLYFDAPLSRQELARDTGLSNGSISNVVGELVAEGVVEEAGSVDSDGGRPRVMLKVAPRHGYVIGVDVGETRVRVALFDLAMRQLAATGHPLADSGHDVSVVVRLILDGLGEVLAEAEVDPSRVLGVGIGVPGIVEQHGPAADAPYGRLAAPSAPAGLAMPYAPESAGRDGQAQLLPGDGAVVHGQTIGWHAVPLGRLLRAGTDLPLHIDNGAKTLGQAEMWFGAGRGARHAVIALLGSGVGACVVADGVPYRGATSSAGEWGHTTMRVGGRPCRCGARGCLEAYVGAEALIERWGAAPEGAGEEAAIAALLAADESGDPDARALLADAAEYLGAGIADLVNLFNPERIVLSGWTGVMLGPRLLPAIRGATAAYALRQPADRAAIELGRLGPDAVTVGAATLPLARFLDAGGRLPTPAEPKTGGLSLLSTTTPAVRGPVATT
jgi:predicted NBD/HSP70 family sugar kinase